MLKHVMWWDEKRGWRWIGAEEAARMYKSTVRAGDHIFKCAVCDQFLAFANSTKRVRFFTHTNNSKSCPEKQCGTSDVYYKEPINFELKSRTLPLRLAIDKMNKTFRLEIGLAPLPDNLYQQALEKQTKIEVHYVLDGTDQKSMFLPSRLYKLGTTFLSLNVLAARYWLKLSNPPKELVNYWAESTVALTNGALFDASSHKIVTPNGEIVACRPYYFLSDSPQSSHYGVKLEPLPYRPILPHSTFSKNLRLYRLEVKIFDKYTWRYIDGLGLGVRLTTSAPTMFPIWPPYVANSSLVYYEKHRNEGSFYNWIFIKGDVGFKAFPTGSILHFYPPMGTVNYVDNKPTDFRLARVDFSGRGMVGATVDTIATGRNDDIVKSSSFWKTELTSICRERTPSVTITSKDVSLDKDVYYAPVPQKIVVKVEYDGFLDVVEQERVIERKKLYPGVSHVFEPGYDQKIIVWQGREVVRQISFLSKRPQEKNSTELNDALPDDQALVAQLMLIHGNEIAIPWTLRSILPKLKKRPLVKRWVLDSIRKGRVPQKADLLLRKTFL